MHQRFPMLVGLADRVLVEFFVFVQQQLHNLQGNRAMKELTIGDSLSHLFRFGKSSVCGQKNIHKRRFELSIVRDEILHQPRQCGRFDKAYSNCLPTNVRYFVVVLSFILEKEQKIKSMVTVSEQKKLRRQTYSAIARCRPMVSHLF
jgi:hypothetical protein